MSAETLKWRSYEYSSSCGLTLQQVQNHDKFPWVLKDDVTGEYVGGGDTLEEAKIEAERYRKENPRKPYA